MSCINNCTFTGRIVQQPELKTTQSGKSVCTFSIANERGYGNNKRVYYPTLIAWNGQAEFVSKLAKGAMIAVVAEYIERNWTTKDGEKRRAYEFVIKEVQALERKQNNEPDFDVEEIEPDGDLPF